MELLPILQHRPHFSTFIHAIPAAHNLHGMEENVLHLEIKHECLKTNSEILEWECWTMMVWCYMIPPQNFHSHPLMSACLKTTYPSNPSLNPTCFIKPLPTSQVRNSLIFLGCDSVSVISYGIDHIQPSVSNIYQDFIYHLPKWAPSEKGLFFFIFAQATEPCTQQVLNWCLMNHWMNRM